MDLESDILYANLMRRVNRLKLWNSFWCLLATAAVIIGGLFYLKNELNRSQTTPYSTWNGSALTIVIYGGDPIVITHLVAGFSASAALPKPIVMFPSDSVQLSKDEIDKLAWRGPYNEPTSPPGKDAIITALYERPFTTEIRPEYIYK